MDSFTLLVGASGSGKSTILNAIAGFIPINDGAVVINEKDVTQLPPKDQMRKEIRALQQQLGITVIYVTHDQTEAMTMGDQVMVLNKGSIILGVRPENIVISENGALRGELTHIEPWVMEPILRSYMVISGNYRHNSLDEPWFCIPNLAGCNQAIPQDLYQVADLDGASWLMRLRKITIPATSPTIFFVTVVTLINAFQTFGQVDILTSGGPDYHTNLLVYAIYQDAFVNHSVGRAAHSQYFDNYYHALYYDSVLRENRKGANYANE
ncbi:hypothetical protein Pfo_031445 [Paulownia fortunei]|nr:hypothetical protein Pfo_031445 [Paulownia fortunei]